MMNRSRIGTGGVGVSRAGAGFLALSLALLASGCSLFGGGGEGKAMVCPATFAAPDADKFATFRPGGAGTIADVRYGVKVQSVTSKCERADKGILVKTHVEFVLVAPDITVRTGQFSYFASVVDARQNILTKDTYTLPFEFDPHARQMTIEDDLIEQLPLRDVTTGGNYAIVIGLQLTQEQLDFNRRSNAPAVNASPVPAPSSRP